MQDQNLRSGDDFRPKGRYRDTKDQPENGTIKVLKQRSDTTQIDAQDKNIPSTHGSYGSLILHPKWKSRRREILTRDQNRCVICQDKRELQVHHRQYHFDAATNQFKTPWDYPDHLLLTLCATCHARGHAKFKVPIIKI